MLLSPTHSCYALIVYLPHTYTLKLIKTSDKLKLKNGFVARIIYCFFFKFHSQQLKLIIV